VIVICLITKSHWSPRQPQAMFIYPNKSEKGRKMKIKYTSKNQRMNVEIDSDSVKDTFKKLAEFQEVFDESSCTLCNNDDLQFVVRTVDGNDFYELKCKKCSAKRAFGQHKSGGSLFPKNGWHKWNGNQNGTTE